MADPNDSHDLRRFVEAQAGVIESAKRELRAGRKRSHWMWFVFPQVEGLGTSRRSQRYAIGSREEATAYLAHPTLGPRLRECTAIVNGLEGRSAHEVFGSPDDLKFRSSMTLFDAVADGDDPFGTALDRYYDGPDPKTLRFLRNE
ncbi:DUF1810 domain-containing protein [Halorubrum ezzemoulense]|jgi:uncharacterized protein (DUF1810 family)|uniref:Calpastatin n=2 Tax=Halorubrum ezzemoulense TaxID=337243 RepID=A0A256JNG9_HALEZ|nr:DUF1810 domain-containing protein [Halorubrum ezzemoulense]MDB2224255.1 DUF1810 domain-containing protein [Halorubrum ezzemoulense]MDB2243908.1 DUF1810 domain-containing protein [Halorubrum ezzemoulense]MDB2251974.1 DUF1810 domain-containing protein [Halorubrum ezzemoulense]MDB2269636.1 DUF1810 domain-containing protein [Halorubrum ezzemoulense]MDB2277644.1 DUF1810 domain-containing protein [Halorubrum ezzemoulense]